MNDLQWGYWSGVVAGVIAVLVFYFIAPIHCVMDDPGNVAPICTHGDSH